MSTNTTKEQGQNMAKNIKKNVENATKYGSKKTSELLENPYKYLFIELLVLVCIYLFIYKWHPFNLAEQYPAITDTLWIILLFFMIVSYFFIKKRASINSNISLSTLFSKASATIGALLFIVAIFLLVFWIINKFPSITSVILFTINIFILAGFIGIVYLILNNFLKSNNSNNTYLNFLKNFILYIPCLIINFAEYLKYQWQITTKTVWIILGLEIILITLRFLIPYVFNYLLSKDGTTLLTDPIYLNNEKTLGTFNDLNTIQDNGEPSPNYHYAISGWFYINPQPPNTSKAYTKYTNILNYGHKPRVQFNSLENKLRVQVEVNNKKFVNIYTKSDISFQKWHNIVINYDGGNIDIFLDGELVSSKPEIIPYMTYENIIVGAKNGINGGICNVVFYDRVLTKTDIILNYKLLRDKRFPIL